MPTNCACCEITLENDMFSKKQLTKKEPRCNSCTSRKHDKKQCLEDHKVREENEKAVRTRQAHLVSEKQKMSKRFRNNEEDALAYLNDMSRRLSGRSLKREDAVLDFDTFFPKDVEYKNPILSKIIEIIRSNIEKKTILCRGCGPGCDGHFSGTRMFQGVTFPKSPLEMERKRKDDLTNQDMCKRCEKSSPYLTTVMEGSFCRNCYCKFCKGPKEGTGFEIFCPTCGKF